MATGISGNMFTFRNSHYWGNVTGELRRDILRNQQTTGLTAICIQAQTANIFTRLFTLYNMTFGV